MRTRDAEGEPDPAVVIEPAFLKGDDTIAWMQTAGRQGAWRRRLAQPVAMDERGADARVDKGVDGPFGLLEGPQVVRIVSQGRDTVVELIEGAEERAQVIVLRLEARRDVAVEDTEIIVPQPFRTDSAKAGLERVQMHVDRAR